MNLQNNNEYQDLVPPYTEQDYQSLKQSIKERGLLVPIIANSQGIILDGHHRYRSCQELRIECDYIVNDFENELLEKLFVIDSNLTRRHLNNFQRAELALKEKPILEEIAKRNSEANLKQNNNNHNNKNHNHNHSHLSSVRIQTVGRVDQEIGKRAGVGKDTVRRVELILQKAQPILLDKARKGQWKINKVYKKLQHEQKRYELVTGAIELQRSSIQNEDQNIQLLQGDFNVLTKQLSDNSIDLIYVDPFYDEGSLPLYEKLACSLPNSKAWWLYRV